MRIDGSTGRFTHWIVLHCPTMRQIKNVLWADDSTARYAVPAPGASGAIGGPTATVQARKITILAAACLVLIDPDEAESFSETLLADQA